MIKKLLPMHQQSRSHFRDRLRSRFRPGLIGLVFGCLGLSSLTVTAADCGLSRLARVPISMSEGGLPVIPVTVNGRELHFVVSASSTYSGIAPAAAQALGLREMATSNHVEIFSGDKEITHYVEVAGLAIGSLKATRYPLVVLLAQGVGKGIDGMIGVDLLRQYDAEFDFPHGEFSLYSQKHCKGDVVYWTHEFASLGVGGVVIKNAMLYVHSSDAQRAFEQKHAVREIDNPGHFRELVIQDVYLGMDILRKTRLYFAYGEGSLYVSL